MRCFLRKFTQLTNGGRDKYQLCSEPLLPAMRTTLPWGFLTTTLVTCRTGKESKKSSRLIFLYLSGTLQRQLFAWTYRPWYLRKPPFWKTTKVMGPWVPRDPWGPERRCMITKERSNTRRMRAESSARWCRSTRGGQSYSTIPSSTPLSWSSTTPMQASSSWPSWSSFSYPLDCR